MLSEFWVNAAFAEENMETTHFPMTNLVYRVYSSRKTITFSIFFKRTFFRQENILGNKVWPCYIRIWCLAWPVLNYMCFSFKTVISQYSSTAVNWQFSASEWPISSRAQPSFQGSTAVGASLWPASPVLPQLPLELLHHTSCSLSAQLSPSGNYYGQSWVLQW